MHEIAVHKNLPKFGFHRITLAVIVAWNLVYSYMDLRGRPTDSNQSSSLGRHACKQTASFVPVFPVSFYQKRPKSKIDAGFLPTFWGQLKKQRVHIFLAAIPVF
jgi:hypothetical protein